MTRTEVVVRKEIKEILGNRGLVYSFLGLILFFVLLPVALSAVIQASPANAEPDAQLSESIRQLMRLIPELEESPDQIRSTVLVVRHFSIIFLVLPVIGALGSSTSSIVGEKQSRSIEPVLVTPVTSGELLFGKSLGTVVMAVSGTYLGFALYVILIWAVAGPEVVRYGFDLTSLLMVGLLTPLIAILGLGSGVIISSRVKDSRTAQQVGGLIVLPIVFLIAGQISGLFLLGPGFVLVAAIILIVLDVIVMRLGMRVFDRERIISDWR